MVKRPLLFIILLGIASIAMSQQSWEGLATVSRFGRFPAGLYGASNLVPPNTLVSIRNLETGRAERIIITDGVDEPGVFLVLSPEAATLLNISGSGAIRVRLTTIVTDNMPADTASEQPFHRDPDINPAAGVTEYPLPSFEEEIAAAASEPTVEASDGESESQTEAETPVQADGEPSEEPVEVAVADETDPIPDESTIVGEQPETVPVVELPAGSQRGGIAAGVARTRVGQAQESFERPETPLEVERPGEVAESSTDVGEPEVEPEELATPGLAALEPALEMVPSVDTQPEPPGDEEALAEIPEIAPDAGQPSDETRETDPAATSPSETQVEPLLADAANPIQDAITAAVNMIPARDFFPPPVGDESDLGFTGLTRPAESDRLEIALDEAVVPPVDRPEYAGLAPLQATSAIMPAALAEAAVPPEDRPEFALGTPARPSAEVRTPLLPVADVGAEERPAVEEPPRYSAPGVTLIPGSLAEAAIAPEERPELADVGAVDAPLSRELDATLALAEVAGEERPDVADIGPAQAPSGHPLDATLVEAAVAAEERPDIADIGGASAPSAGDIDATLAEAEVGGEDRPEFADLGPALAPGSLPLEAELVEAGVTAPESPDSDGVGMVGAPSDALVAELAEAEPEEVERPEGSLAGVEPTPEGDVPTLAMEPDLASEEILTADGSIQAPSDAPTDLLLTLEPADFRPPEVPNPDDSLIDRESPIEEAEVVVALEAPVAEDPATEAAAEVVEIIDPVDTVAEIPPIGEPIEVAVAPVDRVIPATADLPVVSELMDNNYYLQIGAYTVPATAQVAVDALAATYPMAVMPVDSRGTTVYRVLVGPLEQDETGTLLMWLRAKGYRDTFIRSGTEL